MSIQYGGLTARAGSRQQVFPTRYPLAGALVPYGCPMLRRFSLTKPIYGARIRVMSTTTLPLLILSGASESSEPELLVGRARRAVTLDVVERALGVPGLQPVVVATNSTELARDLSGMPVQVDLDKPGEAFHFGRRLLELISRYGLERCFYVGGGAGALLPAEAMALIVDEVLRADRLLVTNNFYSSDLVAFTPARVLHDHAPPENDNELAWLLGEHAGLPVRELPRDGASQFDVDTPTDLLTLAVHPQAGPRTSALLAGLALDTSALDAALPLFLDRNATVLIAGRVGAATWSYLERETACSTRVLSEERGMRASGRLARGEVRSLLGYFLDAVGLDRFFETMGAMGEALFLDNRAILAHKGLWPSAADRFYSDLRRPDQIADPFLRALTEAAMAARIPVVMGGHSLVSGGMYALVEAAWLRGHDLERHVVPAGL